MQFLIVMVLLLVVMYVLMIRPQRQRQHQQQRMIDGAAVGDDVLTTGGIYGTITRAEGDDVVVEIAEDLEVHMTRRGIAAVLPPESDEEPDELGAEDDEAKAELLDDAEADEGVVTDREEAVTSQAGAETAADDHR